MMFRALLIIALPIFSFGVFRAHGTGSDSSFDQRPLKVFFNPSVDVSSWSTILDALLMNLDYAYVAFERDDESPIVALSYHWDAEANSYAHSEDWNSNLRQLQSSHSYELRNLPHVTRMREHVTAFKKMWVDQHCFPHSRHGSLIEMAPVFRGYVFGSWLTKDAVDRAFASNTVWDLLGSLNKWIGRGWVLQEVTACGYLVNLPAFEYFLERASKTNEAGLIAGTRSLCLLLRRMKGAGEERLADRIIRFYDVGEAAFTFESDREINLPDFSDVGYEAFPIGLQPAGYVLQPEIEVYGDRMSIVDTNGQTISKWFKYRALYCKGNEKRKIRVCSR